MTGRKRPDPVIVTRDGQALARAIAAAYRCPDCAADTAMREPSPGVLVLEVEHDCTCPWYSARRP